MNVRRRLSLKSRSGTVSLHEAPEVGYCLRSILKGSIFYFLFLAGGISRGLPVFGFSTSKVALAVSLCTFVPLEPFPRCSTQAVLAGLNKRCLFLLQLCFGSWGCGEEFLHLGEKGFYTLHMKPPRACFLCVLAVGLAKYV